MVVPSWLRPFNVDVQDAILKVLKDPGTAPLACFDADGTLWSMDIGEAFFRWLIAGDLLPNFRGEKEIYDRYEKEVEKSRADGYFWAVSTMAGIPVEDIVLWSKQMAYAWPNYRTAMHDLVLGLKAAGFEVWIVSATNKWTVTEGGKLIGFDPNQVIGMAAKIKDGVITAEAELPLVANAGKVEIIDRVIGRRPDLAFGDSKGDLEMLEYARQAIVVGERSAPTSLLPVAREKGWPVHEF